MTSRDQRLRHVLAEQRFPAARWELIVGAEFYGADAATRQDLQALPVGTYDSIGSVLIAIERRLRRPIAA